MTFDEFETWLYTHPIQWKQIEPPLPLETSQNLRLHIPRSYRDFLARFGTISLFDSTRVLMSPPQMLTATEFMRGLNQPDEDVYFDHLIPFCDLKANMWYFCFDGEKVVDFDPLDPFSIEHVIASSFEEFLSKTVTR